MWPLSNDKPKNIRDDLYKKIYSKNDVNVEIEYNSVFSGESNEKREILDKIFIDKQINSWLDFIDTLHWSKYLQKPEMIKIVIGKENDIGKIDTTEDMSFAEISTPRWSLKSLYLPDDIKEQILVSLRMQKYKKQLFDEWKINADFNCRPLILNFYGPAGTGKSITAEAIAKELGKKICKVNYSQLESKYVGETPKNIHNVFEKARENDAIIIFDEADSFLSKRLTNITQAADYGVNITRSVMLLELEQFDGVVIFTTNLIKNYDIAFKRRIFSSIAFHYPDFKGRVAIWSIYLNKRIPLEVIVTPEKLAEAFDAVSGADIKDILLYASLIALSRNEIAPELKLDDFKQGYNYVKGKYKDMNEKINTEEVNISDKERRED